MVHLPRGARLELGFDRLDVRGQRQALGAKARRLVLVRDELPSGVTNEPRVVRRALDRADDPPLLRVERGGREALSLVEELGDYLT